MEFSQAFPSGTVRYIFDSFDRVTEIAGDRSVIFLVDQHVLQLHGARFQEKNVIAVPTGEANKTLQTIAALTEKLLEADAHRKTLLVAVGGGLTTDICGMLATNFMRGLDFGFVPTTLLGMCDAAIGGKNGVNVGLHKNMLGTIRQPSFILFDESFLATLPAEEWSNGFAEIIKYGFIKDLGIIATLSAQTIQQYSNTTFNITPLIQTCVQIKNDIVTGDENEQGERKLLNFGHTAGHAFEILYELPHGAAVALGMQFALRLSEQLLGTSADQLVLLRELCAAYDLPLKLRFNPLRTLDVLRSDKKRNADGIDFILIEPAGRPVIKNISTEIIENALNDFADESDH